MPIVNTRDNTPKNKILKRENLKRRRKEKSLHRLRCIT
jgi:hypothetical protein